MPDDHFNSWCMVHGHISNLSKSVSKTVLLCAAFYTKLPSFRDRMSMRYKVRVSKILDLVRDCPSLVNGQNSGRIDSQ